MKIVIPFLFVGIVFGQSPFPSIAPSGLTYLNPNTLKPNAFSYQQADYDRGHNQVLFYPYGSITSTPVANSGVLLVYKPVAGGFSNPANWVEVDLTSPSVNVSPYAWNFGGGFTDGSGPATSVTGLNSTYAYLPPGPRNVIPGGPSREQQGDITVQVNLAALATDPDNVNGHTYSSIDLSAVPSIQGIGGFGGVWANGSAYYCPTGNNKNGDANTVLIRYNSALGAFNNPAAWESFDMSTIPVALSSNGQPDPQLGGMQSAAYIAPYLYLIPFLNGNPITNSPALTAASKLVVYDTTQPFNTGRSFQTFDLSTLSSMDSALFAGGVSANFNGYTGGIVVNGGTKLILVPWGDRYSEYSNSITVEYDSTKSLNDPTAWTYFDLASVNPNAAGYQYGWLDSGGFAWFVPTHNYDSSTLPSIPPFVVYNTALPFNQPSSWTSYPNSGDPSHTGVWLTGAAYDPDTNTAWMASYGTPPTSNPTETSFNLELREVGPAPPSVGANGVVNAASYTAPIAPGSIAAAFGTFRFGSPTTDTNLPLQTSVTGYSLQFAGFPAAPLFFVSTSQSNFQVPWELAGQSQISVSATLSGLTGTSQKVQIAPFAPGIFAANSGGTGQGEIYNLSYQLADSSNPVGAGKYVIIYCTGLGAVSNQPATGSPAPSAPPAQTTTMPIVTIGGVQAQVQFSGLAPGLVGLYQINALVPAGAAAGGAVPVVISIGGLSSNTVTMAVQ